MSSNGIDGVLSTHAEDHRAFFEAGEDYKAVTDRVNKELDVEAAARALLHAAKQQRGRLEQARRSKSRAEDKANAAEL